MATISGKDGAIQIVAAGGSLAAVSGKVTRWELDYVSLSIETPGAGDSVMERVHLRKDWTIRGEFLAANVAGGTNFDLHQGLVGASVAIAVKRVSADTTAYATCATALMDSAVVTSGASEPVTVSFVVKSSGTDLTFDTSLV